MTTPIRSGATGGDPAQLQRMVQALEQRVKALEAVLRINGLNVELVTQGAIKVKASSTLGIEAGGSLAIKGARIDLN